MDLSSFDYWRVKHSFVVAGASIVARRQWAMMSKLTARQVTAIDALMTAKSIDAAAVTVGVTRVTLWRWLQDETFCNALRGATDDAIGQAARRLATLTAKAVDTLADGMSGAASANAIRSADLTLSHAARLVELRDLIERVNALEAAHESTRTN